MAKKRTGLGKGLGALIVNTDSPIVAQKVEGGIQEIEIELIIPNPRQPRLHFNEEELEELAASISEHGVIQPLIVSSGDDGKYTLIAGERRLRASKQAKLKKVPVVIREVSDQQQLEWALIENVQRADLSPLEEAEAYHQLTDVFGLSHAAIAKQVGKSRVAITNRLRLRKLSDAVKTALIAKTISEGHARTLLGISAAEEQEVALEVVIALQLNVRQTEQLVKLTEVFGLALADMATSVKVALIDKVITVEQGHALLRLSPVEAQESALQRVISLKLDIPQTKALVDKLNGKKSPSKEKERKSPEVEELEARLRSRFETKVAMRYTEKGGNITLYYAKDEDLDALLEKLL